MRQNNFGKLFIITGPSGTGKTSLIDALREQFPSLNRVVTHTTRPMRDGEVSGVDYHFVSDELFGKMLKNDEFVEHAKVYGLNYGTSKSSIDAACEEGASAIISIDVQGAKSLKAIYPDRAISVFILPPSIEILRKRLSARGTDDSAVVEKRLSVAEAEMAEQDVFDHQLVNEDFDAALAALKEIIK